MKITKIDMVNFGGYETETVDMNSVTIYLKKNGAGKTTLLKALNYGLCGDFEQSMIKNGAEKMSVRLTFENDFVIERGFNGKTAYSKMGSKKPKITSKEVVNKAIADMYGVPAGSLKVLASSKEIFEMKPDVLGKFIMEQIPCVFTVDDVLNYMDDRTSEKEVLVRQFFKDADKFGQDGIEAAYKYFYQQRAEANARMKTAESRVRGYVFQNPRYADVIQKELDEVLQQIGAFTEREKRFQDAQRQKAVNETSLKVLQTLKNEFNSIQATPANPADYESLNMQENSIRDSIAREQSVIQNINSVLDNTNRIIAALQRGVCPHGENIKCPADWSGYINSMLQQTKAMRNDQGNCQRNLDNLNKQLMDVQQAKKSWEENNRLYNLKVQKYQEYMRLKDTIKPVPEIEPVDTTALKQKKAELEKELRISQKEMEMRKESEAGALAKEQAGVLDDLVNSFSSKGEILQRNLMHYTEVLNTALAEKREGCQLSVNEDGFKVLFEGKDISLCSSGERMMGLFLILDLLNGISGLGILFLDEVGVLDDNSWRCLLQVVKDNASNYNNIVLAGVDHTDTMLTATEIFGA